MNSSGLGYAKAWLYYTRALLADDGELSSKLIGDEVKNFLRAPGDGGVFIKVAEDSPCHADAPSAENESSESLLMLPSVAERSLVEAVHALVLQLAQGNQLQTQLLQVLIQIAEQNAELLAALADEDDEAEREARTYLDGSAM